MSLVAVTVQHGRESHDLALPMDIQSRNLVEGVAQVLKLPGSTGQQYSFSLRTETGARPLSPNASLGDLGILHGAVLTLVGTEVRDAPRRTEACLLSEQGTTYPLKSKITLLGRSDSKSGIFVEIDLAVLAADPKAISRRHAQIEQDGDRFYLLDLGSVNGTRLNGERIPPKEKKSIWDGDLIEFGRGAVRLTFNSGTARQPEKK